LPIFSTEFPNFGLPQGVQKIEARITQTHRIAAPKKSDLSITSDDSVYLHGAEGASLDSKEIIWTAKNDIFLRSRNGDIVIDAKDSINLPQIPIAPAILPSQPNNLHDQYKICVCMPEGKLFLVPMHKGITKLNCAKISRSMKSDPCAT
jgi:beta-sarcoglycan